MKIISIGLLSVVLCGLSSLALAGNLTDPSNAHNLSSTATNAVRATTETRICVFCHTPHGAVAQTSLWNRNDPDSMGSFPLYSSATLNIDDPGIVGLSGYNTTDYPNGASRMCLSCHDGVTAIGEIVNGSTISMTHATLNDFGSGTIDLATSHPISFVYNAAVRDAINVAEGGSNYQLSANTKVTTDSADRMQCTTCHDPHYDTKNSGVYDLPFWSNYTGNELADYDNACQACHLGADWGGSWGGTPQLPHLLP